MGRSTELLGHRFVELMPDKLSDGILYVSMTHATVMHNCPCGCGHEVVTPISPAKWQLEFDGESVSIFPSIGNWSLPCKSHYWIRRGKVIWSHRWTEDEIDEGRAHDRAVAQQYYDEGTLPQDDLFNEKPSNPWKFFNTPRRSK